MTRTAFHATCVLAGDDLTVQQDCYLLVENGSIVFIGNPISSEENVIDMRGKLLCPMFINAHTHVGDSGAKELGVGLPLDQVVTRSDGLKHKFLRSLSSETHIEMMRHGLQEMLRNGIIAAADFREQGLDGVRALRQAAHGLPIRVIVLGRMQENATASEASLEQEAHSLLEEADGLGVRDVTSYPPRLLKKLRQEYPNRLFAAHASEDLPSERLSRQTTGKGQAARLLEWQPNFLVHLTHTPPEEIAKMLNAGVSAVACPRSNGILGDGLPDLANWAQMGLRFGLGSDNMMFTAPDMLREMDYASRMTRGKNLNPAIIQSHKILKAATIEGARILKLENELGSLKPGKRACFIVFDLNTPNLTYQQDVVSAIVHRATPADIAAIYIDGNLYSQEQ
ncbi:MAG: amidohydrolase family protein [Anaerolineae bacterium]|nr:amidohydrolase family protein [Anaerolineae bacterium]